MTLLTLGHAFAYEMECLLRLFFPGERIVVLSEGDPDAPDTVATIRRAGPDGAWELTASVNLCGCAGRAAERLAADTADAEMERMLARLLYDILAERTGKRLSWGILTGVRPVRLYRALAETTQDPVEKLRREYLVSEEKIRLLAGIDRLQRGLLGKAAPDGFSLYVSIPFCPSRCLYCSFVSHDIAGARKLAPDYVRLLCEEIRHTGDIARRRGLRLQTVYIGGGTPTSLEAGDLERIMRAVADSFDLAHLLEYTVEAGRPDTVTREKLAVLRRMGADRVSINPQTMDDGILQAIGRGHTAAQTEAAFSLAREAGFANINMDLIAGLPGDTGAAFGHTLERVLALRPDNVTVHALTVKRSSRLREGGEAFAAPPVDVSKHLDRAQARLAGLGYRPYYLYRQKGTVQNLENTGWALPGSEGLYNVLIMEEIQTILAVGAGASTKLRGPDGGLKRVFNFKFPYEYISRFDEIITRKSEAEALLASWA